MDAARLATHRADGPVPHNAAPAADRGRRIRAGRVLGAAACLGLGLSMLSLGGCSGPPPTASYFPLEPGHRWVFDVVTDWDNATSTHEQQVMSTEGAATLGDKGRAWRRRSDSGVDYWLQSDASGVFRIASKHDNQDVAELDPAPRYVLKMPLAVGTTWQASTTAYLLKRNAEFPPEIRHSHRPVPMTYTIAAIGETLSTRAGEFTDCVRVQGEATMRLFADPVVGFKDMPLHSTEWYCKGAGLVKLQRSEPTGNATFLHGGSLVMELTEWQ